MIGINYKNIIEKYCSVFYEIYLFIFDSCFIWKYIYNLSLISEISFVNSRKR